MGLTVLQNSRTALARRSDWPGQNPEPRRAAAGPRRLAAGPAQRLSMGQEVRLQPEQAREISQANEANRGLACEVAVLDEAGSLLAIAVLQSLGRILRPRKVFHPSNAQP